MLFESISITKYHKMKNDLLTTLRLFDFSNKKKYSQNQLKFSLILIFSFFYTISEAQTITRSFPASGSLILPAGIDQVTVEAWGAGGAGGAANLGGGLARGAAGGGGGAYARGTITGITSQTLDVIVAPITAGGSGNGATGGTSYITGFDGVFKAPGGPGGTAHLASGSAPSGVSGATGAIGNIATANGGASGGGSLSVLSLGLSSGNGGNGGNFGSGGGSGGTGVVSVIGANSNGNPGFEYGGGGAGAASSSSLRNGGSGARGHVNITYTCKTYSLTAIAATNVCTATGTTSLVQLTGTTASLPIGTYTVTYSTTSPSASGLTASMTVSTAGTGSFTATGLNVVGSSTITVNSLTSVDCVSAISTNNQFTITVSAQPTITLGTASAVCSSGVAQNTSLPYSATTNSPSTYSITWNASPTNTFAAINNAALTPGAINIAIPANTQPGTYTGSLTVSNAVCASVVNNFTITVNPRPTITLGTATGVCLSSSAQVTNLTYSATTNLPTTYSIAWNPGPTNNFLAVNNALLNASPISIAIPAGTAAGTYTGTLTVRNANGCVSTGNNFTVTVNPPPAITVGTAPSVCFSNSAQTTNLTYSAATNSPTTYSITWSTSPANSFLTVSNATLNAGSISLAIPAGTAAGIYTGTLTVRNANGCVSTGSNFTVTVNPQPTITLGTATPVCFSSSAQAINLAYSGATNSPTTYGITWNATPANSFATVANAALNASPISIIIPAGTSAGTYTGNLTVQNTTGCASVSYPFNVVINSVPAAPTAAATQQPSCENNTGTITITSPASGTGFTYSINGVDYSNTSGIFTSLSAGSYNIKVKNTASGCESPATPVAINPLITKTWNGNADVNWANAANWTPAGMPLQSDCVNIPDRSNDPVISGTNGSFFVNRLTIESTGSLIVESSNTLTVTNEVNVLGSGILKFENNSSLVQVSNAVNSGNIIYKRNTKPIKRFDITYWSSPITRVPAYQLHDLSPETLYDKYFKYDPVNRWITIVNGMEEMVKGNGYNIRGPQSHNNDFGQIYYGEFIGVPNNGNIQGPPASPENFNLLGNPYPSAIYADQFIYDNRDNLYGTLYFWTSNTLPAIVTPGTNTYTYNSNDYAYYNLSGAVNVGTLTGTGATSPGNQTAPEGYIAAGQGFFAKARTNQSVVFTNSMRVANRNAQFFKTSSATAEIEKHRVWLNLTNTEGAFKQLLIGYITGATNSWDNNYDAVTMSANPYIDFYSINDGKKLVIQGRAIPFVVSDSIPLGYKSTLEGNFTIAIDKTDGNLTTQNIYLQDKVSNTIHNLKSGGYTFSTTIGVFPDRFVLRYTNSGAVLGTDEFNSIDQNVVVSVKDKNIKIQSFKDQENIRETAIYDAGGSLLYRKNQIDEAVWNISNFQSGPQVLLIKITLDNGRTVTKKIIFK